MKIIRVKTTNISDGDSAVIPFRFNNNLDGDVVTSELYVQVPANVSVSATGKVDSHCADVTLKFMNVGTYETTSTVSAAGIYLLMAGGLQECKLSASNTGNAVASVVTKEVF